MTCTIPNRHIPQPIPSLPFMLTLLILCLLLQPTTPQAPFIPLDTVHQSYSEFQINLILNQNRNHPILLTTISNNRSKEAAISILTDVHKNQKQTAFSIIVQCDKFKWNLNHTLGVCQLYYQHMKEKGVEKIVEAEGQDSYFSCQVFLPSEMKIKEKGHTIMKAHNQQYIPDGKHFNVEYLSQVIKKNIPDFVYYIEDQYQLSQFLQQNSQTKQSKQPKLLYFDQNLLAPVFLRKLSALMVGKIDVAVTDDPPLSKKYTTSFDSLIFLEYNFTTLKYQYRKIEFDQYGEPVEQIVGDWEIGRYLKVRKNRDILLDFQYSDYIVYDFQSRGQVQYLLTHGRAIIIGTQPNTQLQPTQRCQPVHQLAKKYGTLFNYACFLNTHFPQIHPKVPPSSSLFILTSTIQNLTQITPSSNLIDYLPKNTSRQKVSTQLQIQLCLRTAQLSQRDPIFYYFTDKKYVDSDAIVRYMNSLPQVTSLLYFCQVYFPEEEVVKRFELKANTIFTLFLIDKEGKRDREGNFKKLQHSSMFLRQLAIQKMLQVYQTRLLHNTLQQISTSQQLTDKCFDHKCIIALLATNRYRQQQQMKMLKQLKLQYEELFRFVWIDGICHWDVARQLKILKKKEKVIDRSYVFYYNQKDITYSLWDGKKFWDKKELEKWIKSLRNTRKINYLKFAIDIENKICKKKGEPAPKLPEQL